MKFRPYDVNQTKLVNLDYRKLLGEDSDTTEQIFVCDLMITKNSTTALEAIALGKPLIVLNLSGKHDISDYVASGVAQGVYKSSELQRIVEKLLADGTKLKK